MQLGKPRRRLQLAQGEGAISARPLLEVVPGEKGRDGAYVWIGNGVSPLYCYATVSLDQIRRFLESFDAEGR